MLDHSDVLITTFILSTNKTYKQLNVKNTQRENDSEHCPRTLKRKLKNWVKFKAAKPGSGILSYYKIVSYIFKIKVSIPYIIFYLLGFSKYFLLLLKIKILLQCALQIDICHSCWYMPYEIIKRSLKVVPLFF